jgi:hypothetical protein
MFALNHPVGPKQTLGDVLLTAGANSVATGDLGANQGYQIWCADNFYCFIRADGVAQAGAVTMPRLRGGVVYTFCTEPGNQFVHVADPNAGAITAYLWPIG